MIDISGVSGSSRFSNQLNQIIKDLNETNAIVRDIFKKLDEFKRATNKAIAKELIKKAETKIEKLRAQVKGITPRFTQLIAKIEEQIDKLKKQLQLPI